MIGFVLSVAAFFTFPAMAWSGTLDAEIGSPWALLGSAVGTAVVALLIGMIFAQTIGMAAMGWMAGSVVAAVIALFTGQLAFVLPLLITAMLAWVVQMVLAARAGVLYR